MTTTGIQKILCPVDFSETSANALRYAAALAPCWNATLVVLHADVFAPPAYFTEAQVEQLVKEWGETEAAAERVLHEFVRRTLGELAPRVETVVVEGPAADAIFIGASTFRADLIVMGTHGRRGWRQLLLGSVAEQVLHGSEIPVLMVRPEFAGPEGGLGIKGILCPVNDTRVARKSLSLAAQISHCYKATLTLLHVNEPSPEHAIADLCSWASEDERSLCQMREISREGKVPDEVLKVASEVNCDLLVLGAWHRRFQDRTILGSATAPIVRHSKCPVLIVPGKESDAETDGSGRPPSSATNIP